MLARRPEPEPEPEPGSEAHFRQAMGEALQQPDEPQLATDAAIVAAATFVMQRPSDCRRAGCSGAIVSVDGHPVSTCGLAGCKHNWNPTHGGCGTDYPQAPTTGADAQAIVAALHQQRTDLRTRLWQPINPGDGLCSLCGGSGTLMCWQAGQPEFWDCPACGGAGVRAQSAPPTVQRRKRI